MRTNKFSFNNYYPENKIIILTILAGIFWCSLITISYLWSHNSDKESTLELARQYDRALIEKDLLLIKWNVKYGGVYINSDTTSGHKAYSNTDSELKLINPPGMIRSVYELERENSDIISQLIGLDLDKSKISNEDWKNNALKKFKEGVGEFSELQIINNKKFMSLIRPLLIGKECLKCHENSGDKIGDVVGAISVSVPMDRLFYKMNNSEINLLTGHLIIGLFGLAFIIYGGIKLNNSFNLLRNSESDMKRLVEEITSSKEIIEDNLHQNNILLEKLDRSRERLKTALNTRHKFFSIIAHDLRSPFTSLLGFSNLLVEDYDELTEEERQKFIGNINETLKSLLDLVNNLLNWSRFQLYNTNIETGEVVLSNIIDTVFKTLNISALRKNITLKTNCPNNIKIKADKDMIETVIRNLASNAVKFTNEKGLINVNVIPGDDFVEIIVEDNGVGMSEDILHNLFKLEANVASRGTANEKGVGLGLLVCKEFIEKHNGRLLISSKINTGTRISFTLPVDLSESGNSEFASENQILLTD